MKNRDQSRALSFFLTALCCVVMFASASYAEIKADNTAQNAPQSQASTSDSASEQAPPLTNEEKPRGQLLYDNHCHVCHESNVHIRANRKAKTRKDIQYWVNRWSEHLKLKWNTNDKNDVASYLNLTYYHYPEDVVE